MAKFVSEQWGLRHDPERDPDVFRTITRFYTMSQFFEDSLAKLRKEHDALIRRKNTKTSSNGVWTRYAYPVVTAGHTPLFWRYDLNPATNPRLLERFGINSAFNSGAIKLGGKYILVVRVEGSDRKSFFAVAESDNGVDNFRFWPHPVTIPGETATNVYDMRLTAHEDGWIYGVFCAECHDPAAAPGDLSSAVASAGVVRTKDLKTWERLPDIKSATQQRNVVLHPEFVDGKYALYTRPQEGFIDAGGAHVRHRQPPSHWRTGHLRHPRPFPHQPERGCIPPERR